MLCAVRRFSFARRSYSCLLGNRAANLCRPTLSSSPRTRCNVTPFPTTNTTKTICSRSFSTASTIMSAPSVTCFFDKDTSTCQYVVVDPATKACAIIDSVLDYDPVSGRTSTANVDRLTQFVQNQGANVEWILETHVHADHLTGSAELKKRFPTAKTAIGDKVTVVQQHFKPIFLMDDLATDGSQWDKLLCDGDTFSLGSLTASVMLTTGHTPACMTYVIGDAVFTGDTIFMPDMGTARCDFPMGSPQLLYQSIQRVLGLPDSHRVFVGHDYQPGGREVRWETTVKDERAANVHVGNGTALDKFVEWRTTRDKSLGLPRLIVPSLQVNLRAGQLPKFIVIPVNKL